MSAGTKTLHKAALSLVYSTVEYCALVWYHNAHTRLIDNVLNDALRIATRSLRLTPTYHLSVFSGIQPAELHQLGPKFSLAYCGSLDLDYIKYVLLGVSSVACQKRRPFAPVSLNLLKSLSGLGIRLFQRKNYS